MALSNLFSYAADNADVWRSPDPALQQEPDPRKVTGFRE
jgi:hypothetical protein